MDFYMVNPSDSPKNKKNKKSKRRNPELLIVNPYSLNEEGVAEKKRAKMAKKNRKRNPVALRRRNPDFAAIKAEFLGPDLDNVKKAGIMAVGGGFALAAGSALIGARFGESAAAKAAVAIISGVAGGVAAKIIGDKLGLKLLSDAAVPGAMGAMVLGAWSLVQKPVEDFAAKTLAAGGLAGFGSWSKEFEGLGQSYYDEFTSGVAPGMNGLGQPVVAATDLTNPEDNPFLHGYEPLGDIYNSQRIGSFEAESGYGGFVPETPNARDQQVADTMKNAAGDYGGYEGTLFEPFIDD